MGSVAADADADAVDTGVVVEAAAAPETGTSSADDGGVSETAGTAGSACAADRSGVVPDGGRRCALGGSGGNCADGSKLVWLRLHKPGDVAGSTVPAADGRAEPEPPTLPAPGGVGDAPPQL